MRKVSGIFILLLLGMVLVACGAEDDEPEPTVEPTTLVESEPTEDADIQVPGTPAVTPGEETGFVASPDSPPATVGPTRTLVDGAFPATPAATPESTPLPAIEVTDVATPASPVASPIVSSVSPVASPATTPVASATPGATPEADNAGLAAPPAIGSVQAEPRLMIELTGVVVLNGAENQAYIVTDEGCVGLGEHAHLRDGRQVIVRDEEGTIVSVADLEAVEDVEGCAWEFVVQVPESDFYSVSVPMTFEQVFPNAQVNENDGDVVIELP